MAQINYVNINGTDYPVDPEAFSNLAPVYDSTATYAVNDHVIYNYLLYRCKTAITTAEAWTAAHWEQVQVSDGMVKPASSSGTYVISQDNGNMGLLVLGSNSASAGLHLGMYIDSDGDLCQQ